MIKEGVWEKEKELEECENKKNVVKMWSERKKMNLTVPGDQRDTHYLAPLGKSHSFSPATESNTKPLNK